VATSQRRAHVPWNPSKRKWSARAGGTQRATLFSLGASLIRATSGRWLAPSDARGRNPARTEPNCGHQREGVGFEPTEPRDGASGFKPVALDPKSRLAGASAYRRVLLDLVRGDSESARRGDCG